MNDSPKTDDSKNQPPGVFQTYKEFAPFLTLGFQMAAAVLILFFLGNWIDSKYDTSPLFSLTGVAIGTVGGLIKFIRSVTQLGKQKPSNHSRT